MVLIGIVFLQMLFGNCFVLYQSVLFLAVFTYNIMKCYKFKIDTHIQQYHEKLSNIAT